MIRRRRGRDIVSELHEDARWSWFTNRYVRGRWPRQGGGLRDSDWSMWAVMGAYLIIAGWIVGAIAALSVLVWLVSWVSDLIKGA